MECDPHYYYYIVPSAAVRKLEGQWNYALFDVFVSVLGSRIPIDRRLCAEGLCERSGCFGVCSIPTRIQIERRVAQSGRLGRHSFVLVEVMLILLKIIDRLGYGRRWVNHHSYRWHCHG